MFQLQMRWYFISFYFLVKYKILRNVKMFINVRWDNMKATMVDDSNYQHGENRSRMPFI